MVSTEILTERNVRCESRLQRHLVTPFYEMSLRTLTVPDFSPETVNGLRDAKGKRGDGHLRVASVDIDRARSDPLFRRRVLQGHSVFMTRIEVNDTYRKIDCDILGDLA